MVKRVKRLARKIEGFEKQEKKHLEKLETEVGRKDTTPAYWEKEISQFKRQRKILEKKLKRLKRESKSP